MSVRGWIVANTPIRHHDACIQYANAVMRTTVTLDADVEALLRETMRKHGQNFKQALNDAIRAGLAQRTIATPFRQRCFALGKARVELTKALALADELDDQRLAKQHRP